LVSYNVPPYGRAGLYLSLANLKELVDEYRVTYRKDNVDITLCQTIYDTARLSGMVNDVPLYHVPGDKTTVITDIDIPVEVWSSVGFEDWIQQLSDYLIILQNRLFSSGLR
jgi:magnesium chelatase subunit H